MENNSLNLENREGYSRDSLPPLSVLIWSLRQGVLAAGSRDKTSPLIPKDLDRGLGDRLAWFSRHTTASTRKSARRDARGEGEKEKESKRRATRVGRLGYRNCNTVGHGLEPLLSPRLMIYVIMNHVYLRSSRPCVEPWITVKLPYPYLEPAPGINYPATRDLTLNWRAAD